MNRLPTPGAPSAVIWPPMATTSSRQIARPSPVPPNRRVVDESAWTNLSNRLAICSGFRPMPVSETLNRRPPSEAPMATSTAPALVNFTALDTRLLSTWRTRTASPR